MNKGYYLVRAMGQTQNDFDIFFNNNVVAVGWSEVDFSKYSDEDLLVKEVDRVYYTSRDVAPQVAGKKKNEVRRFKGIKNEDRIIVPFWGAEQLTGVLESQDDLFSEYKLVLVTSATPSKDLVELCDKKGIILIAGDNLVDWIFKSLPMMDFGTKKRLAISDIPTILQ